MKRASLIGVLGLVGYALFPATSALAAPASASAAGPVTVHGTASHAARIAQARSGFAGLHAARPRAGTAGGHVLPFRSPGGPDPASKGAKAAARMATNKPAAVSYRIGAARATVAHHFNGISNADQAAVNGGQYVTPPDQGLCAGPIAISGYHGTAVFELVNSALRITKPDGTPVLGDISLVDLFGDNYAEGDPRCLWDPASQRYYFTEIGFPPSGPAADSNNTTVDVAVADKSGAVSAYQFDTSLGGPSQGDCFGDQPKTGFGNGALVISTDEYCGPQETDYLGAIVLEIPKKQLAAGKSNVSDEVFGPVSLGGVPVTGLDPAISTGTGTEYLVNSFPYDAAGNNNAVSSSLGLWSLKGDTLKGRLIHSESYAFPVPALSTGDGSTDSNGITSEAALNPDDSRLSGPVMVTRNASGAVQLWTALDAAVAPKGDPTARDGAAWFRIDTGKQRVASQGYVAVKGAYLLYPALLAPPHGAPAMVFSITSPGLNPSSAFTTLGSEKVKVVAAGSGPHLSWADVPYGPRWGDYSFTALDPSGKGVWMATEYIPPKSAWDAHDNWGTSVFEVH